MANIDSHVLMSQINRNDSNNVGLMKTDKNRASLKDIGRLRGRDYLGGYLERITKNVKIPQSQV